MKNLKIAFLVLLAAVLMASCTQVKIVDMIPGGDKEETPVSDLPKIIDPETILRDAANGAEGLSYEVETSNEPFASRAAGDDAAAPVYYQMVVTFRGYKSSYGLINRGTLTFDFTDNEENLSYVANGNGLVVASNTEVRTRRTDAEGLVGTVKGFVIGDGIVSVTADYSVEVNPYKGSFTSGRDKVTIAESKGVVSGGNGTADSPFIISDLKTLKNIDEFGDNVSFQLGADFTNLSEPITIENNNITLDLNGHNLKNTNENSVIEVQGGYLRITGDGIVETIRDVSSGSASVYAARVFADGTLVIDGGTYYGDGGLASGIYNSEKQSNGNLIVNDCYAESQEFCIAVYCASTLEVNGGKFVAKDNAVVGTNGSLLVAGVDEEYRGDNDPEYPAYDITINGGEFEGHIITPGYIANGIYMANKGTVTLNGGIFNITNGVGVLVRSGTLIAYDVTINLTYEGIEPGEVGDSHVKVTADSQIVVDKLSKDNYRGSYPSVLVNTTDYPTVDQAGQPFTGLDI